MSAESNSKEHVLRISDGVYFVPKPLVTMVCFGFSRATKKYIYLAKHQ